MFVVLFYFEVWIAGVVSCEALPSCPLSWLDSWHRFRCLWWLKIRGFSVSVKTGACWVRLKTSRSPSFCWFSLSSCFLCNPCNPPQTHRDTALSFYLHLIWFFIPSLLFSLHLQPIWKSLWPFGKFCSWLLLKCGVWLCEEFLLWFRVSLL